MTASKDQYRFTYIFFSIGLVVGVIGNVSSFQQGGRVSLITLGLFPVLGAALGGWIDGKHDKN